MAESTPILCSGCEGRGWVTMPDHHPRCDGSCIHCPIAVQAQCPDCGYESGDSGEAHDG